MTKKDKIKNHIVKVMNQLDPSGENGERYKKLFDSMNERKFKDYMQKLKDGDIQIYIVTPNLKIHLKMNDIKKAAKITNTKLYQKIWMTDKDTGVEYLSNEEYPIYNLPIKRMQQTVDKKLNVASSKAKIDSMTGTVSESDKSSSISNPEIQILFANGLETTLKELLKMRGGDSHAYSEFKRQLEETGQVDLERISKDSKTRSVVINDVLFKTIHYKTNFADGVVKGVAHE